MSVPDLEPVYFVTLHEFHTTQRGQAEPVILVDAALAHRHENVRLIEVFDRPIEDGEDAGPTPVAPIDPREAVFFPAARTAAILRDHRTVPSEEPSSTAASEFSRTA